MSKEYPDKPEGWFPTRTNQDMDVWKRMAQFKDLMTGHYWGVKWKK